MQPNKHPEYVPVSITCACGHVYKTRSARTETFNLDVCSQCHPFFTGKQKLLDTAGRVERFRTKYKATNEKAAADKAVADEKKAAAAAAAPPKAPKAEKKPKAEKTEKAASEKPAEEPKAKA